MELSPQLRTLRDFYYKTAKKLPEGQDYVHAQGLIDKPSFFTLEHLKTHLNNPLLMPTWFKLVSVDQRFFDFPQDRGYTWANAPDTTFEFSHLEMVGPTDPYRMIPDRFTVVPIVLHNRGTSRMPTCSEGGDPYHLVFTTYTLDGKEYQRGSAYSSLETDLAPGTSYTQGLVVERPVDKGRYTVHAQLLLKGKVIGPEVRFQIVVDGWPF